MKNLSATAAVKVVAAIAAFFLGFSWALPWDRLAAHALGHNAGSCLLCPVADQSRR